MSAGALLRAAAAATAVAMASPAPATPSSVFWTAATVETQPTWIPHLTYDTYFGEAGALQIDTGLTLGLLDSRHLAIEAGVDLFHPTLTSRGQLGTLDFAQLNAKVTLRPGDRAGAGVSLGISNVGFTRDVSNYDVLYGVIGIPSRVGKLSFGGYYGVGSELLWSRSADSGSRGGLLLSWVSPAIRVEARGLDGILFLIDAATGKNWLGGIGAAIALQLTPAIAVKTGPVVFRDWDLYESSGLPKWLWSVQLDADLDLRPRGAAPSPPAG